MKHLPLPPARLAACWIGLGASLLPALATALTLAAFSNSMVFFVAPSDIATKAPVGRSFGPWQLAQCSS